jgi:ABC-type amino acid transport substrate-binding protein
MRELLSTHFHRWFDNRRWKLTLVFLAFGVVVSSSFANSQSLDDIQKNKLLKVCIWPEYFGISYVNSRTNVLQGIDIDLSKAFAKDLGVKLEYVHTSFTNFTDDLRTEKCHIAMMGVGITPERLQKVKFSKPYLRSDIYAIALKANTSINTWDDIDRVGKVVVVQKGTYMEPVLRGYLRNANLYAASKPGEREKEVESGRADVFATDYPYSQKMLQNTDWAKVIAPNKPIRQTEYAYAIKLDDDAWLIRVNQFVAQIKKDGRLSQAAATHKLTPIVVKDE